MNVNINTLVTRFSFFKNRIIILLMIREGDYNGELRNNENTK